MTREEWLRSAVESIDRCIYGGDLDLLLNEYQISCGRCAGKKLVEHIRPSDDIDLTDRFPITISVDHKIKDPLDIFINLSHECMKAFLNARTKKRLEKAGEKYFWDEPYKEPHPSPYLLDLIKEALEDTESRVGKWPGVPVVMPIKKPQEPRQTKVSFFCPECGWKAYSPIKMMRNKEGSPTCLCGTKMEREVPDEKDND